MQEAAGPNIDTDYSALSSRDLLTKGLDELKASMARRRAAAAADHDAAQAVVRARSAAAAAAAAAKTAERQSAGQQVGCPCARASFPARGPRLRPPMELLQQGVRQC